MVVNSQLCAHAGVGGIHCLGEVCGWKVAYLSFGKLLNWVVPDLAVQRVEPSPTPILSTTTKNSGENTKSDDLRTLKSKQWQEYWGGKSKVNNQHGGEFTLFLKQTLTTLT